MTPLDSDGSPPTCKNRGAALWRQVLHRHQWLGFVLPFAVFMLMGLLEPTPVGHVPGEQAVVAGRAADTDRSPGTEPAPSKPPLLSYPLAYTMRIAATLATMVLVGPVYRCAPPRMGPAAIAVGVAGGVIWVLICRVGLEDRLWEWMGRPSWASFGARAAFNPMAAYGPWNVAVVAFLAVRFFGLVVIVPLIEEFFLRGFLMRFFLKPDWWTIPLGTVTVTSAAIATAYGVLAHPAEPLAAFVWFTLITLLYARTRNLWDCVCAHAITNAMLGIYVLMWEDWTLW